MKQALSIFGIFTILFLISKPVHAGDGTTGDYFREIGTKFVRGIGNILASPGEIGCSIKEDYGNKKFAGVFTGFGKGIVFMLRRMLVGVDETVTFMIPMERTLPPPCWCKQ